MQILEQKTAAQFAEAHILAAVDATGHDVPEPVTDTEKAQFLYNRFVSEYGWRVQQAGKRKALIDWLQGLAISIAFYNYDILRLAVLWGQLPENATEQQEDSILENHWGFMADALLALWEKNGIRAGQVY